MNFNSAEEYTCNEMLFVDELFTLMTHEMEGTVDRKRIMGMISTIPKLVKNISSFVVIWSFKSVFYDHWFVMEHAWFDGGSNVSWKRLISLMIDPPEDTEIWKLFCKKQIAAPSSGLLLLIRRAETFGVLKFRLQKRGCVSVTWTLCSNILILLMASICIGFSEEDTLSHLGCYHVQAVDDAKKSVASRQTKRQKTIESSPQPNVFFDTTESGFNTPPIEPLYSTVANGGLTHFMFTQ